MFVGVTSASIVSQPNVIATGSEHQHQWHCYISLILAGAIGDGQALQFNITPINQSTRSAHQKVVRIAKQTVLKVDRPKCGPVGDEWIYHPYHGEYVSVLGHRVMDLMSKSARF